MAVIATAATMAAMVHRRSTTADGRRYAPTCNPLCYRLAACAACAPHAAQRRADHMSCSCIAGRKLRGRARLRGMLYFAAFVIACDGEHGCAEVPAEIQRTMRMALGWNGAMARAHAVTTVASVSRASRMHTCHSIRSSR